MIAGGRASRFGGDKALADWHGLPLIARAAEALRPFCVRVVVVGRDWGGLTRVDDLPSAGLGPLGGIAGVLARAAADGLTGVLTIGCDMPDVPSALVARLAARAPSYCADAPILGHWPTASAPALVEQLRRAAAEGEGGGALSIRRWAQAIGALPLPADAPLANVNTREDLPSADLPATVVPA